MNWLPQGRTDPIPPGYNEQLPHSVWPLSLSFVNHEKRKTERKSMRVGIRQGVKDSIKGAILETERVTCRIRLLACSGVTTLPMPNSIWRASQTSFLISACKDLRHLSSTSLSSARNSSRASSGYFKKKQTISNVHKISSWFRNKRKEQVRVDSIMDTIVRTFFSFVSNTLLLLHLLKHLQSSHCTGGGPGSSLEKKLGIEEYFK